MASSHWQASYNSAIDDIHSLRPGINAQYNVVPQQARPTGLAEPIEGRHYALILVFQKYITDERRVDKGQ